MATPLSGNKIAPVGVGVPGTPAALTPNQPDRRLRLVLIQQLPIHGEQRFSWKLSAAATYAF